MACASRMHLLSWIDFPKISDSLKGLNTSLNPRWPPLQGTRDHAGASSQENTKHGYNAHIIVNTKFALVQPWRQKLLCLGPFASY